MFQAFFLAPCFLLAGFLGPRQFSLALLPLSVPSLTLGFLPSFVVSFFEVSGALSRPLLSLFNLLGPAFGCVLVHDCLIIFLHGFDLGLKFLRG